MIRTNHVFGIFLILSLTIFPYYIFYLQSDFLSSLVPGWNTTIYPGQIILNLIKFTFLSVTTICYWKLSRIENKITFKKFLNHFLLTIPAIIIGKISLDSLTIIYLSTENFLNRIKIIVLINICLNILFIIGQVVFWNYFVKVKYNPQRQ